MATQAEVTRFLEDYVAGWPRDHAALSPAYRLRPLPPPRLVAHERTAEQIADDLLVDAAFKALQLGTWLATPDGQLIKAAIEALSPPPYRQDIELLVQALTIAAKLQQKEARRNAVAAGLAIAAGSALLAAASRS